MSYFFIQLWKIIAHWILVVSLFIQINNYLLFVYCSVFTHIYSRSCFAQ